MTLVNIVISVVSHYHFNLIKSLGSLEKLASVFSVHVIDNVGEEGFYDWCKKYNISYVKNHNKCGFGENNNKLFKQAFTEITEDDYFLVLNPDIIVSADEIMKLAISMKSDSTKLATINLFKDSGFSCYDNAIRRFPVLTDFIHSYLLGRNPSIIDKSIIKKPTKVDWASGAFLMFNAFLYNRINGFDDGYFMYCEDVDICLRAKLIANESLVYYPDIKALHLAAHSNRRLLSKSFFWHLNSIIRYLMVRRELIKK